MSRYRDRMGNDRKTQKRDWKTAAQGQCDDVHDDHQCYVAVSLWRK